MTIIIFKIKSKLFISKLIPIYQNLEASKTKRHNNDAQ